MTATDLAAAIHSRRFHFKDEKELQRGVSMLLKELKLESYPEVILTKKDRIDFIVRADDPAFFIGIEVKVDSPQALVTRQLWRYSECSEIQSLILVTSRSKHTNLPPEMNGKPLHLVYLLNSFL